MHFTTVREIARTSARSVCSITFARRETAVSIVRDERGAEYLRVAERIATEGVNDRPEIHETDLCYPLPNGASGLRGICSVYGSPSGPVKAPRPSSIMRASRSRWREVT